MQKFIRIFILFLLVVNRIVFAQQYNFRNYSVEDGIAQSQVYALLQDHRGYIWFGTRGGGITRFDGISFKTLTEKEGLLNNYIYAIKEDLKGNIWISTNKGLSYYNGVKFVNYTPEGYNGNVQIFDLAIDKKNQLWLATTHGLLFFNGKTFRNISDELQLKRETVNAVLLDQKGDLWFGSQDGLRKISFSAQGNKLTDYKRVSHYMSNAITSLAEDHSGKIWIGTYGGGAFYFNGKSFHPIGSGDVLHKTTVLDIFVDNRNTIWLATLNKGVLNFQPGLGTFSVLSESEGLSNNHVRAIIQDNNHNFWFGTSGGGVCNYMGKQFTAFDKSSGLGGNFIYSIFRDSQNRLWVGNSQKGVSRFENGKFVSYSGSTGFSDTKVKAIAEGYDGTIWLGTDGKGVYVFNDSVFTEIPELKNAYIRGIVRDFNQSIWIATAGRGLYKISFDKGGNSFIHFSATDGLLSNRLTTLICDHRGVIWYGTENDGIGSVLPDGKIGEKYTVENGLPSNMIRALKEDHFGYLWVGTAGSGVCAIPVKMPEKPLLKLNYANGLTSTNIYLLTFDKQGNLLIGTEKGLDYVLLDANRKVRSVKHYSKSDGFTGVETCQNAVFNDPDGTLWFGTINGLIKFNPSRLTKNKQAPVLQITDVKLFYLPLSGTPYAHFAGDWNSIQELELPYNQNHITFDFFAVNLSNPENVRYQWKLDGFDEHWSPPTSDRSILYSNLNPGNYRFLVKACNEDGVWTPNPVVVRFSIAAPFWYRWWFISGVIALILSLITGAVKWRINLLKKKAEKESRQLRMEKEILELEQKALRLQMNPHFIFNALNSIQGQIGTGNDKEARYYLAKFSRLMRQILDNSRNASITLQEEINTLENYLLIEQFCNGNRFDYQLIVPDSLETDFIRIPPMMIQPFVENAVKHGFKSMETRKERWKITLAFSDHTSYLECEITDNGIGREKAREIGRESKDPHHHSLAQSVTQERLELLQDEQNNAILEFTDLYENGIASGTKVRIRIPIH